MERSTPYNGQIRLVKRFYLLSTTLNGEEKRGAQRVYQRYTRDYSNYDAADWECWYDFCWEEQTEYITFPNEIDE